MAPAGGRVNYAGLKWKLELFPARRLAVVTAVPGVVGVKLPFFHLLIDSISVVS